ncbi:hypothetical protein SAMD00019534_043300 [Acytostelium subglobosum LB1]|uniref:hypothetical protein n=1 Tax=Acytostelium subglobosum LB1 TaxID=1410327 RepID=UPI0006448CA7|nr:hypothetical protein SAMD00019534_043300 [Acytostelium subglobosum LB1]GAM21155.1 hypothetical protein SAMD00019534_043300 [Acytostelium subglobosum LB1]|eukprot:XP_012756289.1 hypothetical protein SAMD00019534_043300 [Acytostelium subglobosum LB1]
MNWIANSIANSPDKYEPYLASIDSPEELAFINSHPALGGVINSSYTFYINGANNAGSNSFQYNSGPLKDGNIFTYRPFARCYTVCPWAANYPDYTLQIATVPQYLTLVKENGQVAFQHKPYTTNQIFLIEWNGYSDPLIPMPPTTGGSIQITNFITEEVTKALWNMPTLLVNIIDLVSGVSTPVSITQKLPTSIKINVPPGFKRFNLSIDDTKGRTFSQVVHYQLPYINTVYARGFTVGSLVTITGGNFGTTANELSITMAGAACTGYSVVEAYTSVACNLAASTTSTLSLLPITVGYGVNNYAATYRNNLPFYDPNSMTTIRVCANCVASLANINTWTLASATNGIIDGNRPYVGVVYNAAQSATIVNSYSLGSNRLMEALDTYTANSISYKDQYSPFFKVAAYTPFSAGTPGVCVPTAVYCNGDAMPYSTYYVTFGQENGIGKQYSNGDNTVAGELVYYGGFKPTQSASNINLKVDTAGGTVSYSVGSGSVGFKFTQRSFTMFGVNYTFPNVYQTDLFAVNLVIPAGTGVNVPVTIYIESYPALTNLFITYNPPTITKISPSITSIPGKVIVSGTNFGSSAGSITAKITLGALTIPVTCRVLTAHVSLECDFPGGFGTQTFTLTVGGQVVTSSYTYQPPVITVQPINNGDVLVLTGTGFGTVLTNMALSIPTVAGTATLTTVSDPQTYTVKVVTTTKNGPIFTTVGGQVSNTMYMTYKPAVTGVSGVSTSTASSIVIAGSFLSLTRSNSSSCDVSILIDSTPCTIPSNPDATSIKCTASALTGSHSIVVTIDGKSSDSFTFAAPSPTVAGNIQQNGETIIITGANFGNNAANVVVTLGGQTISTTSVTDGSITATLPATATNGPLLVTVSSIPSNVQNFEITPIFVSANAIPTDGGALVITGKFLNSVDSANSPLTPTVTIGASTQCKDAAVTQGNTQLTCTAPAGVGKNNAITIAIGSKSTAGTFNYLAPSVTSVVQSPTDPQITVTGANFGQQATAIGVFINGATIQATSFSSGYTQIVATIPTSTKSDDVYVIVGGQSSNSEFLSTIPILATIGQPPAAGGSISIIGTFMQSTDYFGNTLVPTVTIDTNIACTGAAFTGSSGLVVTCLAPAGTGVGHMAVVSINSQASNPSPFEYQAPSIISATQDDKAITVTGVNFGTDASKVTVVFGTAVSNFPTSITDTQIVANIPKDALNGGVNVVVDTQSAAVTLPFDLTPIINTVKSAPIAGGEITITGYFLNSVRQNSDPTTKSVTLLPSTPCNNVNKIADDNNQARFTCTVPSGTGAPTLRVTIDSKSTDTTEFAYGLPTIDSVNVDTTNTITVIGTNLIADGVTTNINYGVYPITTYTVSTDNTTITFSAPAGALADYVHINVGGTDVKYLTPLYPILSSVTPSRTIGSEVTLTGTYLNSFNADSTQTTMTVTINGVSCAVTPDALTSTKYVQAPPGVGTNFEVTIKIGAYSSTINTFNYLPPSMSGVIEQNGQTITVNGDNFGASKDAVTAPTGMTCVSAAHTTVVFSIPTVYQSQSISITVGGQSVSGIFVITPIVNDVAAIYADGGDVVISGSYLNSQSANGTATTVAITFGPMSFTVAGLPCANGVLTGTTTIVCYLGSGGAAAQMISVALPVVVSNDQISATANVFLYSRYDCDSQCLNGGTCQEGYCVCPTGFSGPTCAVPVGAVVQPTLDPSKVTFPVASLVSFTSQIAYIQEYDNNANQVVSTVTIIGATWAESAQSTFDATVQGVSVQVKTDFFNSASDVEYAGETIPVPAGGVKHTVAISGWEFTYQDNVLRVIYESQTPSTFNYNCSTASTSVSHFDNSNMPVSFTLDSPAGFMLVHISDRAYVDTQLYQIQVVQDTTLPAIDGNTVTRYAVVAPSFSKTLVFDPVFVAYQRPSIIINPNCNPTTSTSTTGTSSSTTSTTGTTTTTTTTTTSTTTESATSTTTTTTSPSTTSPSDSTTTTTLSSTTGLSASFKVTPSMMLVALLCIMSFLF